MESREASESVCTSGAASCQAVHSVVMATSSDNAFNARGNSVLDSDTGSDSDVKQDFDAFCRFAFPDSTMCSESLSSELYYFESDHVALKGNEDYCRLLRAFVLLESERTAALQDLDQLLEMQQKALRDPLEFASQLQHGRLTTQLPGPRKLVELPTVPWERYTGDVEAVLASLGGAAHSTRQKEKRELLSGIRGTERMSFPTSSTSSTASESKSVPESKHRPATFNQSWSAEEQRHLEQLLQKYPPERFEARRFAKIAAELPGRTTQQVTSRVQKYFIKLAKAGLPVPGRMPNLAVYGGRWFSGRYHGRQQRHHHFYYPTSTFLTSYAPPVYMSDDGDDADDDEYDDDGKYERQSGEVIGQSGSVGDDDDDDIPECLRDTAEYHELKTLTALRQSIQSTHHHSTDGVDRTCPPRDSEKNRTTNTSQSHIDLDYTSQSTGVSSYLDPNYMPAI